MEVIIAAIVLCTTVELVTLSCFSKHKVFVIYTFMKESIRHIQESGSTVPPLMWFEWRIVSFVYQFSYGADV